jgi:hypothetical protein
MDTAKRIVQHTEVLKMARYEITYTSEDTGCSESKIVDADSETSAINRFQQLVQKDWDIVECLHINDIPFKRGDNVQFGIRFDSRGKLKGGIARKSGVVICVDAKMIVVKSEGKLYNLRELKGGWVLETERDDPKGRLYLKIAN